MLTDPIRNEPDDPLKEIANCHSCKTEMNLLHAGLEFWCWVDSVKERNRPTHVRRSIRLKTSSPTGKRYAY